MHIIHVIYHYIPLLCGYQFNFLPQYPHILWIVHAWHIVLYLLFGSSDINIESIHYLCSWYLQFFVISETAVLGQYLKYEWDWPSTSVHPKVLENPVIGYSSNDHWCHIIESCRARILWASMLEHVRMWDGTDKCWMTLVNRKIRNVEGLGFSLVQLWGFAMMRTLRTAIWYK